MGDQSQHYKITVSIASLIPFMGVKTSGSSRPQAAIFSVGSVGGLGIPRSFMICATTFWLNEYTVTDPFYIVGFMMVPIYIKDPPNSFEQDGSEAKGRRWRLKIQQRLTGWTSCSMRQYCIDDCQTYEQNI